MNISEGVVHTLPDDFKRQLLDNESALLTWEDITPLARNEWICWVEDAKREQTRQKRIRVAIENLMSGKRRPCCWPGCPHRDKSK
jgi:uncharacterized protein YdeI (YjbR/CyaY-like superfamily)